MTAEMAQLDNRLLLRLAPKLEPSPDGVRDSLREPPRKLPLESARPMNEARPAAGERLRRSCSCCRRAAQSALRLACRRKYLPVKRLPLVAGASVSV